MAVGMRDDFYPDLIAMPDRAAGEMLCSEETDMWDGPAFCNRIKGHRVDKMTNANLGTGEFHQEAFEGWVWDNERSETHS